MAWKLARRLDSKIADKRERALLAARVQKLLDKWQPILGVRLNEFRIKKMAAWGSLHPPERRLWVSQALARMSNAALEYVVVHELVHLLTDDGPEGSGHNDSFYAAMDSYLPTWRRRHAKLRHGGVVAAPLPRLR